MPFAGSTASSGTLGPLVPQLARANRLTLAGTWTGTVALTRSVDSGATRVAATIGGKTLSYAAPLNEPVAVESEEGAT